MKKRIYVITFVLSLLFTGASFAFFGSTPKIDVKHIKQDLIGRKVRGWTFGKAEPCRIKILDVKYDKNTAVVYVFVTTARIRFEAGREGKFRLEYEYAANDWNLLEVKPISFSALDVGTTKKFKYEILWPLVLASSDGNLAMVEQLLAKGVDANLKDEDGETALIRAVVAGHNGVVQTLLAKGADINAKNKTGETALLWAAEQGHNDIVKTLLANGADINARNNVGVSALLRAAGPGHNDVIKTLLAHGADINAKSKGLPTPLEIIKRFHPDLYNELFQK